jgi:hypothetical protein
VDVWVHVFLTSAVVGSDWSASRPSHSPSGTHWIGSWVGPRTGPDEEERSKSFPYRDSNSDPSAMQPVTSRYTDCATPAQNIVSFSVILTLSCVLWERKSQHGVACMWRCLTHSDLFKAVLQLSHGGGSHWCGSKLVETWYVEGTANIHTNFGFEVVTAVTVKSVVSWHLTPCKLIGV